MLESLHLNSLHIPFIPVYLEDSNEYIKDIKKTWHNKINFTTTFLHNKEEKYHLLPCPVILKTHSAQIADMYSVDRYFYQRCQKGGTAIMSPRLYESLKKDIIRSTQTLEETVKLKRSNKTQKWEKLHTWVQGLVLYNNTSLTDLTKEKEHVFVTLQVICIGTLATDMSISDDMEVSILTDDEIETSAIIKNAVYNNTDKEYTLDIKFKEPKKLSNSTEFFVVFPFLQDKLESFVGTHLPKAKDQLIKTMYCYSKEGVVGIFANVNQSHLDVKHKAIKVHDRYNINVLEYRDGDVMENKNMRRYKTLAKFDVNPEYCGKLYYY